MIAALEKAGYDAIAVGPGRDQVRRRGNARRSRALRRPVPQAPRRHRRHHRHAAEFRRRARHRRYAAPGRPERAGAGAGHARHAGQDDHRRPPRQLLRQDVGLQQPDAVRHPLFADHAAHRSARFRRVPARTWTGSRPSAAWCNGLRKAAHRRHRRAPGGLQHRALQREDPGGQRHLRRDRSTSPRSSAASRA